MRSFCKTLFNALALVAVFPAAIMCRLERRLRPNSEEVYLFWAHVVATAPGLPGVYLRRAFYRLTLDDCHRDCYIGFGSLFTHRKVVVEAGVYIGSYALIGCAILREGCLIGSRSSLLSGGNQHELDDADGWTPTDLDRLEQIEIGAHAWLGENVTVMAAVGPRAMLSAGSVAAAPVPAGVMVAGNPARFVKRLEPPIAERSAHSAEALAAVAETPESPSSVAALS